MCFFLILVLGELGAGSAERETHSQSQRSHLRCKLFAQGHFVLVSVFLLDFVPVDMTVKKSIDLRKPIVTRLLECM